MRNCFIPGCDQLCKGVAKRRMFSAPKDKELLKAWIAVLPNVRPFKSHDKVCDRHFNEEDVYTTYDNVINGLVYKIERGRPRLRLKAVPCRNLGTDVVVTQRRRKVLKAHSPALQHAKQVVPVNSSQEKDEEVFLNDDQHIEIEEVYEIQEVPTENGTTTKAPVNVPEVEMEHLETIEIQGVEDIQELFEHLYDDIYEVVLPNTLWGVHRCPERSAIFFSYVDPSVLRTTKMITVNCQGQAKILLGNRLVNEQSLIFDLNSTEALSEMISQIDEMKLCPRLFEHELCEVTLKDGSDFCPPCSQSQ